MFFWVDYTTDLEPLRKEATRLAQGSKDCDDRVCLLQVVDTNERAMQLRLIVSSPSAGQSWDLRCLLREGLIGFLQRTQPHALPRVRAEVEGLPPRALQTPSSEERLHEVSTSAQPLPGAPARVNDDTGMASLTAPTGGVPPRHAPR